MTSTQKIQDVITRFAQTTERQVAEAEATLIAHTLSDRPVPRSKIVAVAKARGAHQVIQQMITSIQIAVEAAE